MTSARLRFRLLFACIPFVSSAASAAIVPEDLPMGVAPARVESMADGSMRSYFQYGNRADPAAGSFSGYIRLYWSFRAVPVLDGGRARLRLQADRVVLEQQDNNRGLGALMWGFKMMDEDDVYEVIESIRLEPGGQVISSSTARAQNFEFPLPEGAFLEDAQLVLSLEHFKTRVKVELGTPAFQLSFTDREGRPLTERMIGERFWLKLTSTQDPTPDARDVAVAEIWSGASGDRRTFLLVETGPGTKEYRLEAEDGIALAGEDDEAPGSAVLAEDGVPLHAAVGTRQASLAVAAEPARIAEFRIVGGKGGERVRGAAWLDAAGDDLHVLVRFQGKPQPSQKTVRLQFLPPPEEGEELRPAFDPDGPIKELVLEPADSSDSFRTARISLVRADPISEDWNDTDLSTVPVSGGERFVAVLESTSDWAWVSNAAERQVMLETTARELEWGSPLQVRLRAGLSASAEPRERRFRFYFKPSDGPSADSAPMEEFDVDSNVPSAELAVKWSRELDSFVVSEGTAVVATIEPGRYMLSAGAGGGEPQIRHKTSRQVALNLHPLPLLKVYDVSRDTMTDFWHRPALDRVLLEQEFQVGVYLSPMKDRHPDTVDVTVRSSKETKTFTLKRQDGYGGGIGIYDMRGDKIRPKHLDRPDALYKYELWVNPDGDTITVSHGGAAASLKVSANALSREAEELTEMLKDYQALYAAPLEQIDFGARTRREFLLKSAMLQRAVALQQLKPPLPTWLRITSAKAYLELIQTPPDRLGREGIRYSDPARMGGLEGIAERIPFGWDLEEQKFYAAKREAGENMGRDVMSVLAQIKDMPYHVIKEIPTILASPVYALYTLGSGRTMQGEWASREQTMFAAVEAALVFVPVSVGALKVMRPDLFERAVARLQRASIVNRVFPPTTRRLVSFSRLEYLAKVDKLQKHSARARQTVANAAREAAELTPRVQAAAEELTGLRSSLAAFEANAPSARLAERARERLRELQRKFRERPRRTPADVERYRAGAVREMEMIEKHASTLRGQRAALESEIVDKEKALRKLEQRRAEAIDRGARAEATAVEKAREARELPEFRPDRPEPAARRRVARRKKDQGNAGEDVASETMARDGFIRHVETEGRLPNRMENWDEVRRNVGLFGKSVDDLAEEMGVEAAELERLMAGQASNPAMLGRARAAVNGWADLGVPYYPTGSIGPDDIFWNQKTGNLRILEAKSGRSPLGKTQLTDEGIEVWIENMKNVDGVMYRPKLAEALTQALRSGTLERCVIRVVDGQVTEVKLYRAVGRTRIEPIPVGG